MKTEYAVYRAAEQHPDPFAVEWTYPPPNTEQMPQPAPTGAVVTTGRNEKKYGMGLTKTAIAVVNTRSDGRSLIGKRNAPAPNAMLSYIVEPKPSSLISPPLSYGRIKDVSVLVKGAGRIAHYPLPNAGTLAKPISIKASMVGRSEPAGAIKSTIRVQAAIRVVNTISGSVNRPVGVRAQGLSGWSTVSGSSNPSAGASRPITIRVASSGRGHSTVSGFIDRVRPVFRTLAQGQVLTRAATIYRQIAIQRNIRGWATVSGSILRPVAIKGSALIVFPLTGQIAKPLAITASIRASHVMLRTGGVNATVRFSSSIVAKSVLPVIGSMNRSVPVNGLVVAHHQQPRRGTINGPVRFGYSATGVQNPFGRITNRPVVVTGALTGQQNIFGTLNRQVPVGRNIRGSNLVTGTLTRPLNVGRSMSGFVVTNLSDSYRHWRLRMTSDQSVVGPNEIQFRLADGTAVTGTVTASSSYGAGYGADKAIDRDGSTWWSSAVGSALNSWIAVDLGAGNDRNVADVLIATDAASRVPMAYQLQYSDDGVTWVTKAIGTVAEPENNSIYVTTRVSVEPPVSQTTQYRGMYRFRTISNAGDRVGMAYFALHNPAGLPIPAMSPFASSESSGTAADAFDTDGGTMWVSATGDAQSAELAFYAATLDTSIGSVTIQAGPNVGDGELVPLGFVVEYSADDGDNWNIVYSQETMEPFSDGELRVISFTVSGAVDIGDGAVLAVNDNNDVLGY